MESSLRRLLYRFDCPESQVLGDYQLDLLDAEQRMTVAAHAAECDECTADLRTLRAFLATEPAVSEPLGQRVRRIVATLFTPSPGLALGAVRGAADAAMRQYVAEDLTLSLAPGSESGSLIGLVTGTEGIADLEGCPVRLHGATGTLATATVDDLGNFEFEGIADGVYSLEIDLGDRIIAVQDLQVG